MSNPQLILYQFSREKVEKGDYSVFLDRFGRPQLPEGSALAKMMGGMAFMVEGYDQDPREIYGIPEVRRFYASLHAQWPYWLYFCDLNQDALKTMVMFCVPSLESVARSDRPVVGVTLNPIELLRFVANDFNPMNQMCDRAGLSERAIYDRSKAVMEFFGFPFDAQPPP